MERDPAGRKEGARNLLAIAASPVPGEVILPALLARFQAEHPATSVREAIGDTGTVVARLLRREVELAVIGGPLRDERCEIEVVARDELALIAPRRHPLARLRAVTAERVCREPLVLREEGSGARAAVEAAFAAAGIPAEQVRVAAELGSTEAVKAAVAAGLGVGFVSVCALVAGGPAGGLRALPMADFVPARDLLLLVERGRPLSNLAQAFRAFLLSDAIRREVAASTRLPSRLRADAANDPLLEPPAVPRLELASTRPPSSEDEERVERILARLPIRTRGALVAALADDLRRSEDDPFRVAPDAGLWRLSLYQQAADELVGRLLGDFLTARAAQPDPPTG